MKMTKPLYPIAMKEIIKHNSIWLAEQAPRHDFFWFKEFLILPMANETNRDFVIWYTGCS